MKAHIIIPKFLMYQSRNNMLSGMLLHPVKPHLPENTALHLLSCLNRLLRIMIDHTVLLVNIHHFHFSQEARISILAAALRKKHCTVQHDPPAILPWFAGQYPGIENASVAVLKI